ncbi:MAG: sensor protein KdpD, partial [Candidatus Kapabacteria bacterium]|nr:sensor protein KdpD [Candidatus Kapabacteria bacterium]
MNHHIPNPEYFLQLIKKKRLGTCKIYLGMSAGVGKTYRMLQEAHILLRNGVDVKIGYVETHKRYDTEKLIEGLPIIPRKKIFYKGKEIEEMDLDTIIAQRPEVIIVDELAHSNIEGSKHKKRWEDVLEILSYGINVITAVNIQHLESLHDSIHVITGIDVTERIPDSFLSHADEVVNIDLTADELLFRLREGKIYTQEKIATALQNFFTYDTILQLRELALKEVASHVERKVETEVTKEHALRPQRFMVCIETNEKIAKSVIRKTARLAHYYQSQWFALYVQTDKESPEKIPLHKQRHLLQNMELVLQLGGEVIKVASNDRGTM